MNATQIEQEIKITEKATKEIKRIMDENKIPDTFGLRVGVKGGRYSGLTYTLGFESDQKEGDTVIESQGIKFFVDGKSLFYLLGTVLDFSDGLNGRGFVFNNPNAKRTTG